MKNEAEQLPVSARREQLVGARQYTRREKRQPGVGKFRS